MDKQILIGHRGMRGILPENSLMGLDYCIDQQLAGVEFDVQFSKDGTPFVYHDLKLNRAFTKLNGQWLKKGDTPWFNHLTDHEIAQLTIGELNRSSQYGNRFVKQKRIANIKVPTLDNWLSRANPNADFIYLLEIKSKPYDWPSAYEVEKQAQMLIPYLEKHRRKNIIVESFDWRVIFALKNALNEDEHNFRYCLLSYQQGGSDDNIVNHQWTTPFRESNYENIVELVQATEIDVWAPFYRDAKQPLIEKAKDIGLSVYPWTVNRLGTATKLLTWGCNGIISDYPIHLKNTNRPL